MALVPFSPSSPFEARHVAVLRRVCPGVITRFNANIRLMAANTFDTPNDRAWPLVAVGYGPRCVPVMQVTEAAANRCDLLWMVDGSLPEMHQMTDLLNQFGPVVDISGLSPDQILELLTGPFRPDALVTYLDANMTTFAGVAEALDLPFHSLATARALVDKAEQRRVLAAAGLDSPTCRVLPRGEDIESALTDDKVSWPAVLKPRSAQGSRYTFLVHDGAELRDYLSALGDTRPDMVLEDYLPDDPRRSGEPYAPYVSVESIVARGVASHLAVTGRFPLAENFRETGFFIPAALSEVDEAMVLGLASLALEALGVRTGCLHTEIKFTPDGPRIIEVNGRVGGGVPEMLDRAAGVRLVELTLRLALGENIQIDGPVPTTSIGYRFFLQPPAMSATVAAIAGLDVLSEHPGVDAISVHQGPGATLDWRDGSRNHIMAVVGSAKDYEELRAVDRLLHQEVTVSYANVSHF